MKVKGIDPSLYGSWSSGIFQLCADSIASCTWYSSMEAHQSVFVRGVYRDGLRHGSYLRHRARYQSTMLYVPESFWRNLL